MDATLAIGLNGGLLSVSAVAALLISMGTIVFLSDTRSITHKSFLALTGTSVVWSVFNYIIYKSSNPIVVLWSLRFIMFTATWFAYSLFTFFYVFPNREQELPRWYKFFLLPITASISIVTLTPLVFTAVSSFSATGQVQQVTNGPGIFLFGMLVFALDFGAIFLLTQKTLRARSSTENPYHLILIGTITTILLIIIFSFILPAFFGNSMLVAYGTLFFLPFIGFTAYAIDRGHILNVKEIGVAFLASSLAIATLIEIIFTTDPILILFRTSLFILILIVGLLLIRGVVREVQQREKIQKLADELQETNKGQENLIHIMNHQIKGYLGTARNIFAELLQSNDYGQMPEPSKPLLSKGLEEMTAGVDYVQQILKGASAHSGSISYDMKLVDLKNLLSNLAIKEKEVAEKGGLSFESQIANGDYNVVGDATLLEESFKNLITNAIKYNNPSGSIAVTLSRAGGKILFSVKDTGRGISEEDAPKLFKPGGVGKDSIKYNVESSGFGLAFVKPVVEKHHGRVWYESNSPEQGTTFFIELPIASTGSPTL
ncbi:hypothetical protein KGM48_00765 [Patescibacteria group bacterium]|nr:hypothetical protein [Patescibacteria group bacterium]